MSVIDKKRIAKNTLMLYIRMILITLVTLYTSRIVLEVLGVEDFGIYNVVGGIVIMLGFINSAMSSATQRFLSFELGRKDTEQFKKVFSTSIIIHIIIALFVICIAETVGLWFLNYKMVIPESRMVAANWVYQFSILAFVVKILSVPYNASIISHERMSAFAYISILEVVLKLGIVFMLNLIDVDKLQLYSVLIFVVGLIIALTYRYYCIKKFNNCRFTFTWDILLVKEILVFSGWNIFGGIAGVVKFNGINVLLNLFFGTLVNAAWGIASQVNGAVSVMISNFTTAINPPLIKLYANKDYDGTVLLMFNGMKFSFFLTSCIVFPFILNADLILHIWLKNVPEYSVIFTKFALITLLLESIMWPIVAVINATGRVKLYQSIVGSILILNLVISYFFLLYIDNPVIVCYISLGVSACAMISRFIILYKFVKYSFSYLVKLLITMLSIVIFNLPLFIFCKNFESGIINALLFSVISIIITTLSLWFLGMTKIERKIILEKILVKLKKKND